MEHKIEDMSALADARHELSSEFSGDDLERRFDQLGGGEEDTEAELLAIKERLQIGHKEGG